MSASLVGSEMCIRDRTFRRCQATMWPLSTYVATSGQRRSEDEAKTRRRRCLLYTSDAADDM
eukprot:9577435-Alexandrium_andersonii.AAC.1